MTTTGAPATAGISFTYDLATAIGLVRLYAGDTDTGKLNATGGDRTRTDSEITALLAENGGEVRLAGAALLEGKAAEYAQQAVSESQGQLRQDYRQRSDRMLAVAQEIRGGAAGPILQAEASGGTAFAIGSNDETDMKEW